MLPISGLAQAGHKRFSRRLKCAAVQTKFGRSKGFGALPLTSEHHIQLIAECGVFAFGYPYAQLATANSSKSGKAGKDLSWLKISILTLVKITLIHPDFS